MAHHIYTTDGFVLSSHPFGEANLFFKVFTRDFGLVFASARSVREIKSKLRYGLADFCLSSISFVRGKHEWKITSALPKKNLHHKFAQNKHKFLVCAHALSLIKKLVAGEEKNTELFDIVQTGFDFIEKNDFTEQELRSTECIMMLRIVHNLGYFMANSSLAPFIDIVDWNKNLVLEMNNHRTTAVREINRAIKESQL
ncbi:hypothetical protein EXS61_01220 [Candidatus Parcubacteria bacterium]|nr:hypothetical protein [Candidatus Parcubacteria bacterium]